MSLWGAGRRPALRVPPKQSNPLLNPVCHGILPNEGFEICLKRKYQKPLDQKTHLQFHWPLLASEDTCTPVTEASSHAIPSLPRPRRRLPCWWSIRWELQDLRLPSPLLASGVGCAGSAGAPWGLGEEGHRMLGVSPARGCPGYLTHCITA